MKPQYRVIIEQVSPEIDGGRFAAKRVVGQFLEVKADIFSDGHDVIKARLHYRHESEQDWHILPLEPQKNDVWEAKVLMEKQGYYYYKVSAWIDYACNWLHGLEKKLKDGQDVSIELWDGAQYIACLQDNKQANAEHKTYLAKLARLLEGAKDNEKTYLQAIEEATSSKLAEIFEKFPHQPFVTEYDRHLRVYVDRQKALFSTWYEFFPRSASQEIGRHGTFKDCERVLPRVADLGFDTLYFPPIHPIGKIHRKGKNNSTTAEPDDVGSPWAIGSPDGGHKDLHPELGTLEDFKSLLRTAEALGIEIAMDYALQCAPEHPYVKAHPQWFKWRPDGTVQYAENPPKKYQDILPIYFETEDWQALWDELVSILFYWCEVGIRVFRVDNPHTKAFTYWEWAIAQVKERYPDVIFLSEAFTRPKVTNGLAKLGFTQSYTYYTWRNSKAELIAYMTQLTQTNESNFFRPNFWVNTPDINPFALQSGLETVHLTRLFMAATLSSSYGVYGPVFEFMKCEAIPAKEEYFDSEKYEFKHWNWQHRNKITIMMKLINEARRENKALQETNNFVNCPTSDEHIFAYYKANQDQDNHLICVVNLDAHATRAAMVQVPLERLGIGKHETFAVYDIMSGNSYHWGGEWNYVELNPYSLPFHLFRVERLR